MVTSATLADVATTLWGSPVTASTPIWAFRPKYHLLPPLGLLHLRIALFSLFFGRRGGRHDSRVDDGAFTHEQALLSQVGVDLLENPLGQRMLLQQVTEAQECGRVRYAFARQIDTHEVAHRLTIVDRIFERLVGDRIPLLQEVDPQHALQADGRTAAFARYVREVGWRQRVDEPLTRHQRLHLDQEPLAAGHLLLALVLCLGERDLLHRETRSGGNREARFPPVDGCQEAVAGFVQRFPSGHVHCRASLGQIPGRGRATALAACLYCLR